LNENTSNPAPRRRRRKKKKNLRVVLIILCIVLLCVFGFSAYKVISTMYGYKQAEKTYTEVANQFATVVSSPTPVPVEENTSTEEEEEKDKIDPEVSPLHIDFAGLRAQSTDYVAWIYSPDTKINYPIAYTDNNFYYLDHIPGEQVNSNGTIFIDCRNASDFSDQNTCIYGHNMNDGSMFASLRDYREASYYNDHPVIYLSTPDFNYRLDLIAGLITEPTSFAYVSNFQSDDQFLHHVETLKSLSTFQSDVEVGPDDKIVTLSTCTYERDDGRYIVVGKLTQIH